eukprot:m.181695 g.181695  ORF g.181695 m.181695 type:complete len:98 (-) comp16874_c0_seq5:2682-2975(-)
MLRMNWRTSSNAQFKTYTAVPIRLSNNPNPLKNTKTSTLHRHLLRCLDLVDCSTLQLKMLRSVDVPKPSVCPEYESLAQGQLGLQHAPTPVLAAPGR